MRKIPSPRRNARPSFTRLVCCAPSIICMRGTLSIGTPGRSGRLGRGWQMGLGKWENITMVLFLEVGQVVRHAYVFEGAIGLRLASSCLKLRMSFQSQSPKTIKGLCIAGNCLDDAFPVEALKSLPQGSFPRLKGQERPITQT